MKIVSEKYHGLGNDYLMFDPNKSTLKLLQENVKLICDRCFDVGSDDTLEGLILGKEKMEVHIWNSGGSIMWKSGNGVCIFAKYLRDAGYVQKTHVTLPTLAGDVGAQYLNEEGTRMKVSMGKVSLWSDEIPMSGERREVINEAMILGKIPYRAICATVGNPHCVTLLNGISKDIVCRIGKNSENAGYSPERVNTQAMHITDRQNTEIEVYEHGADYTLAPGSSGYVAVAVTYKQGLADPEIYVRTPGGALEIEILNDWTVPMTGDVGFVGTTQLGNTLAEQLRALE